MAANSGSPQPYPPSWVDWLLDRIERLPGPVWTFYAGLLVAMILLGVVFHAPNNPEIPGGLLTSMSAFILAGTHWLRRVTARCIERARPALDLSESDFRDLSYRLTFAPARMAWILAVVEVVYLPIYVMSSAEPFGYRELPPHLLVPGLVGWAFGEAVGWVLLAVTLRRLYFIGTIQKNLARVELFRQQPLHAFSAVTLRTSIVLLVLFGYVPLLSIGSEAFKDPYYLGSLLAGAVLAVAVTILPLVGTHRALIEERRRRAMDNGQQIESAMAALSVSVERGAGPEIESHQKALGALLVQRDLINKAHTWPWAPGTVRTLATTVLLPIVLLATGRILDRWLSA